VRAILRRADVALVVRVAYQRDPFPIGALTVVRALVNHHVRC
jgi:hypothetical protein